MFEIRWNKKTRNFLRKLDKNISERIVKKVDSLKENPSRFLDRITGINCFKLRIGDYRVFIDLDQNKKIIAVRLIKHRRDAYKKLFQILTEIR